MNEWPPSAGGVDSPSIDRLAQQICALSRAPTTRMAVEIILAGARAPDAEEAGGADAVGSPPSAPQLSTWPERTSGAQRTHQAKFPSAPTAQVPLFAQSEFRAQVSPHLGPEKPTGHELCSRSVPRVSVTGKQAVSRTRSVAAEPFLHTVDGGTRATVGTIAIDFACVGARQTGPAGEARATQLAVSGSGNGDSHNITHALTMFFRRPPRRTLRFRCSWCC